MTSRLDFSNLPVDAQIVCLQKFLDAAEKVPDSAIFLQFRKSGFWGHVIDNEPWLCSAMDLNAQGRALFLGNDKLVYSQDLLKPRWLSQYLFRSSPRPSERIKGLSPKEILISRLNCVLYVLHHGSTLEQFYMPDQLATFRIRHAQDIKTWVRSLGKNILHISHTDIVDV